MVAFEHISNGRAPNTIAQLEQLSFDFAVAPTRIFFGETKDQCLKFGRNARPAYRLPMGKGPLVPHQLTMPPQHGLRCEEQQTLAESSTGVRGPLHQFGRQHGKG